MSLKSLCCVWTLLLLVQHTLCFSLEKHCARRCLYGRGGIICKCNAIHFTGKRSYDPKHSYSNPLSNHDNRHGFLLSIINRPEFLKSLASASLSDQDGRGEAGDTKPIQLVGSSDEGNSEGFETDDDNVMNVGDAPSQPEVFFNSDKVFGGLGGQQRKFPLYRYNGFTRELAHLVQNAWQHLAPQTSNNNIEIPADSFSSSQIEPTAEVYDNQQNDLLAGDESEEEDDDDDDNLLSNRKAKFRTRLSLVRSLEELIKRLPTLIHGYKSGDSARDVELVGAHADDIQNLLQPGDQLDDVEERRKLAWNRLMKYLANTLNRKERHRTKRDGGESQPDVEVVAKGDGTEV